MVSDEMVSDGEGLIGEGPIGEGLIGGGSTGAGALFEPARIGSLRIRNRIVRAATVESMASERGEVRPPMVKLLERLAEHDVGLIITGGMYVHPRGQSSRYQAGIYSDDLIAGLSAIPSAVHHHGGHVFAQLQHAGNQSSVVDDLVSPGDRSNLLTGRTPSRPATTEEIEEVVRSFGDAARRAVQAGFDGVHIHGANGYLISSFSSPLSNRRTDRWGGSASNRSRFLCEIVASIRACVPDDFPVTLKLGIEDAIPEGLSLDEAAERVALVTEAGVDAVEVSVNLMAAPEDSARRFVAVDRRIARRDLIFNFDAAEETEEAYFASYARGIRARCPDTTIMLVGGIRTLPTMQRVIDEGIADLVCLSRPFIRQPDLVERLRLGASASADCTSCNLCLELARRYPLRCWRRPRHRLLHALAVKSFRRLRSSLPR
jgi:2,4-dienoyl-CoA reductase-like NADH-dependent reductase (Old Yellow Enzyme family)